MWHNRCGDCKMNIEPDSIVLPRLIPWLAESRLRLMTSEILLTVTGIFMVYVWFTRFFSLVFFMITVIAILFAFIVLWIAQQPIQPMDDAGHDLQTPNFCPDCGIPQYGTIFCQNCGLKHC